MPFTISHAAAVLPFTRPLARWRLLSAAVIGSMVPDFGWFLPWRPARFETHSLDALLTFCLPVGLASYWVFQLLVRTPIMELLPPGAYARWHWSEAPADYRSLKQWILGRLRPARWGDHPSRLGRLHPRGRARGAHAADPGRACGLHRWAPDRRPAARAGSELPDRSDRGGSGGRVWIAAREGGRREPCRVGCAPASGTPGSRPMYWQPRP